MPALSFLCFSFVLFCFYLLQYIACAAAASTDEGTRLKNALLGNQQRWPGNTGYTLDGLGGFYVYHGNPNLTSLLDVGACYLVDSSISYVPPLDGASADDTLCQDLYAMKMVLFDLQLVQLKSVDPVGGAFRVELQMVLHWMDSIIPGSKPISPAPDECSFLCDTSSPRPTCCDGVWVPPLKLPGCDINNVISSTPYPPVLFVPSGIMNSTDCFRDANGGQCIWRRLWYLNIDATCQSDMDFHNFPFDSQDLIVDLINPYASRTWFQLTKGFLKKNIGEDINGINLSPDSKIPGWFIKDLIVSSTCGVSQTWLQTFLAQDKLLSALSNNYESQRTDINDALNPKQLTCSRMEDFNMSKDDENLISLGNQEPYSIAREKYEERVNSTLVDYKQCIQDKGQTFSWNRTILQEGNTTLDIPEFGLFNTSPDNIRRSFSLLDLQYDEKFYKVWFPCAIVAIANLTTPGIRVTIRVQRYRMFYVVKLILPTVACVAFTFTAFGLKPHDLLGRLTVVVPSVIALTALQGLVVSTDIPPVAYIAPSTYIILISYTSQVLIAFESIFVNWLFTRKSFQRRHGKREPLPGRDAPLMRSTSQEAFAKAFANDENQYIPMNSTRILDLLFMGFLGVSYIITILCCTLLPYHRSEMTERNYSTGFISIWKSS